MDRLEYPNRTAGFAFNRFLKNKTWCNQIYKALFVEKWEHLEQ